MQEFVGNTNINFNLQYSAWSASYLGDQLQLVIIWNKLFVIIWKMADELTLNEK